MQPLQTISDRAPRLVPSERPDGIVACQYYVIRAEAGWTVQCGGENSDPFITRQEAIRAACGLAHLDDIRGRYAEVVVQGEDDVFRLAWIAGDCYPPERHTLETGRLQHSGMLSH